VIFTFVPRLRDCSAKARITGTVIATSPMAERRITAICWIGFCNIDSWFTINPLFFGHFLAISLYTNLLKIKAPRQTY
jgi:hypothetical protein